MKRIYVKPELEVVMFSPESSMLSSSMPMGGEDAAGTNKRQPQTNGWSQEQWTEN